MDPLTNRSAIRALMEKHSFTFSKSLGQNFIVNPTVCPRIAEEGGAAPSTGVLEIGPGIGVLTAELARRAGKVVCLEIDHRLLPILDETLAEFPNVTVLHADVLKTDLAALIDREFAGMEVVVCANLPYYITSPVVMTLLESRLPIRAATVMVQKEAARRICAPPGTRESGAISAAAWYYSIPQVLFPVARGSFYPAPEVDSAVIRLDIRQSPAVTTEDEPTLFRVIRGAFSQRRKTVLNALSPALELPKAEASAMLEQAAVPSSARAEELTLEQFAAIADEVFRRGHGNSISFLASI